MYNPPAVPYAVQTGGFVASGGAASVALGAAHLVLAAIVVGMILATAVSLLVRRTEWR